MNPSTESPLLSRGMIAVISAQFLSAFGDNALLFATLALIKQQLYPDWSQPILQMAFVATYIILAPFVGQVADSFAKGRVMMFANALKLAGALVICFGGNPFLGYSLVGVGAAAYSPAKYGILGEITSGEKLVKANGLMEASTIAAMAFSTFMWGAGAPNIFALLAKATSSKVSATAGGIFNGLGNFAGALAPVLMGALIAATGNMDNGLLFLVVMAFVGCLILLPLLRKY